jgi:transposase
MNKDLIIHALRKEIESLKDSLEKEQLARAAAEEAYKELQTKHAMMEFHYDNLKRMVFQSRSERSSVITEQSTEHGKVIDMFDAATEARLREDFAGIAAEIEAREKEIEEKIEAGSGKKKTTYKPTGRQAFGEHLLRKYTYEDPKGIDLSKATLVGQDKTEVLHYTPATLWVETHFRNKYIIKDEETGVKTFHQAPALQRPIDRISAGPSLLASLIVDKYIYHLPIHRQLAKFERLGCIIAAGTACGWLDKVQELLILIPD